MGKIRRSNLGFYFKQNVVAVGGSNLELDMTTTNRHKVTLSEDITLTFVEPAPNADDSSVAGGVQIIFIQDSSPRTITFPDNVNHNGGTQATIPTASGARFYFTLIWDGDSRVWDAELGGADGYS